MRRLLSLFLLAVTPVCASAQMMIDLRPGARVRVTAPGVLAGRLEGIIIERSADSIVVATPSTAQFRIALASASNISVSQGKSRSLGAMKGGLWTGGIMGGLALSMTGGDEEYIGLAFAMAATYGAIGAGIGAIIGSEAWSTYSGPVRPSVVATRNGARVGANLRF